jgi:hypothetical protein
MNIAEAVLLVHDVNIFGCEVSGRERRQVMRREVARGIL